MLKFGTDGIRGAAGVEPCTEAVAEKIGAAALRLARQYGGNRVLVARDRRPSGAALAEAVCRGVERSGGLCHYAEVLPTAGVSIGLAAGMADTGVMVTASHNPASDNGFKVISLGGHKLSDDERLRVEDWLALTIEDAPGGSIETVSDDAWSLYLQSIRDAITDPTAFIGRKIALDCANGALSPIAKYLNEVIPAEWVFVAAGDGVINEGVGSEYPNKLAETVVAHGCEAGIAVDGDADRCRLVDASGEVVVGDALAWMLATTMKVRALAVTVMSNGALEGALPTVRVVRTPVGDRHLRAAMNDEDIPLGCEESGHVLFSDRVAGDGLTTGLRALTAAPHFGGLTTWSRGFVPLPRQVAKVRVKSRPPLEEVQSLVDLQRRRLGELGTGGRIFLRYSGTEPVLRVLVEGNSPDAIRDVLDEACAVAAEALS